MYANCPECERTTQATTWEDEYGDVHGAVWCAYCGWNDANSKIMRHVYQTNTAASLGLTVEAFQEQLRDESRQRWLAADPELAPF